jgi:hypothetical protein
MTPALIRQTLTVGLSAWALVAAAAEPPRLAHIRQLDLIHFSHTDYGFTDHPAVCRDMQRRYLDVALDTALATRKRPDDAPTATRREFVSTLKRELPVALAHLQRGNIAPVDLAQAAIGPGMAVYTRYAKVVEPDGKLLTVREALALINQILDISKLLPQ